MSSDCFEEIYAKNIHIFPNQLIYETKCPRAFYTSALIILKNSSFPIFSSWVMSTLLSDVEEGLGQESLLNKIPRTFLLSL